MNKRIEHQGHTGTAVAHWRPRASTTTSQWCAVCHYTEIYKQSKNLNPTEKTDTFGVSFPKHGSLIRLLHTATVPCAGTTWQPLYHQQFSAYHAKSHSARWEGFSFPCPTIVQNVKPFILPCGYMRKILFLISAAAQPTWNIASQY